MSEPSAADPAADPAAGPTGDDAAVNTPTMTTPAALGRLLRESPALRKVLG